MGSFGTEPRRSTRRARLGNERLAGSSERERDSSRGFSGRGRSQPGAGRVKLSERPARRTVFLRLAMAPGTGMVLSEGGDGIGWDRTG